MAITYRGTTIPFAKHTKTIFARPQKIIAYPAVNGTAEMDMGKRQRAFSITGLITDLEAGSFTDTTIEGWNDGYTGDLVIHNRTFSNVKAGQAQFDEPFRSAVDGKLVQRFTIPFRQISP